YVMPYCKSLHDYLSENGIDRAEFEYLACEILNALAYMHSLSLCHCDIKPSNIFLMRLKDNPIKLQDYQILLGDFDAVRSTHDKFSTRSNTKRWVSELNSQ